MEQRALIAVVISLIILLTYQELVIKRYYPPHSPLDANATPAEAPAAPSVPPPQGAPDAALAANPAPAAAAPAAVGREVTVETPLYTAILGTVGARFKSFRLKHYRTTVDPNSPPLETIVAGEAGELPVGVDLRGPQGTAPLSDAADSFTADKDGLTLTAGQTGDIEFTWAGPGGVSERKHFTFSADGYEVTGAIAVRGIPAEYNEIGLSWSKAVDQVSPVDGEVIFDRAAHVEGKKLVEDRFDKIDAAKVVTGDIGWAGYAGRYFFEALVITAPQSPRLWLKRHAQTIEQELLVPHAAGPVAEIPIDIYIGPKDVDALEGLGHDFAQAVDLGRFWFIARPLLRILTFSHHITGNYGVDIIALTLLIKILFIPLTQTSLKSMRAMQKLQPQMTKIREKYKDTPDQMNKEIMELYRRHKVNPFGGCLPMVLQIPVFIGLYAALNNAVEMRHAPFLLWINDLAAPERLGSLQLPFVQHAGIPVLTLLMGASMFAQQWMTPSTGDPTQRQMMMIMPLMFTFMFVNFPAGLSLYWLVNNILTIAQQYYMNRTAT